MTSLHELDPGKLPKVDTPQRVPRPGKSPLTWTPGMSISGVLTSNSRPIPRFESQEELSSVVMNHMFYVSGPAPNVAGYANGWATCSSCKSWFRAEDWPAVFTTLRGIYLGTYEERFHYPWVSFHSLKYIQNNSLFLCCIFMSGSIQSRCEN